MTTFNLDIFDIEHSELCNLYWQIQKSGEFTFKISEISEKTGIYKYDIPKIVKNSCVAYSTNIFCKTCENPKFFVSRTEYQSSAHGPDWECQNCLNERQFSVDDRKRGLIESHLKVAKENPICVADMSFRHAIFLLALIRYSADEGLTQIQSLKTNQTDRLTPDLDYDLHITKELFYAGIIAISPLSPLEAIEIKEEGGFTFNIRQVCWEVPLVTGDSLPRVVYQIETRLAKNEDLNSGYESVKDLCEEICLLECLAYLNLVVQDHKLSFKVGEKTKLVLSSALQKFSVAQVYNFIWRAGKDAAAFFLRSGVSKKHAANTIVSNIQRQYERAIANEWNVKPFDRNFNMGQSIISQVIFNLALKSDDGGFHKKLEEII